MDDKQETEQIYNQGQAILDLTHSAGWIIVKNLFSDRILDLQSVRNITNRDPEQIILEVGARQLAVDYMMQLLKDIEGLAQQHDTNKTLARDSIIHEI